MRLKEELEGLQDVLEEIKEEEEEVPIIVEGRKDVQALKELGFERKIIRIKKNDTIFHIIEDLREEYERVIILTDWDSTGGKLSGKIKKACQANIIDYDLEYRREIIKYVKKEIKDVESIPSFIKRAERIVSNPYESRNLKKS
ncbi:MAG: toprim domain-containing protein [Thermoplasmata archaeon]